MSANLEPTADNLAWVAACHGRDVRENLDRFRFWIRRGDRELANRHAFAAAHHARLAAGCARHARLAGL